MNESPPAVAGWLRCPIQSCKTRLYFTFEELDRALKWAPDTFEFEATFQALRDHLKLVHRLGLLA